ncbi:MAG: DinB family protein [Terriglobales bacterium]
MANGYGVAFDTLIEYLDAEAERWQQWLAKQPPGALDVPVGTDDLSTVWRMLAHIAVVEYRYAQRLLDEPVTPYNAFRTGSLAGIFQIGEEARQKLTAFLASATESAFDEEITFDTKVAGTVNASKRKILAHVLLHSVRHWAQLATVLRQNGYPQDWQHDFLFTEAMQ